MEKCPCCSQKAYMDCCGIYLETPAKAPTPVALMRSRYTAHVKLKIDYIMDTIHPTTRGQSHRENVELWAKQADWTRLEVLQTIAGKTEDIGRVVFRAHYKVDNQPRVHVEDSTFKKENGEWFYLGGREPQLKTVRTNTKIGRNDPCYCGSGKKFKKCCGKK